MKYLIPPPPPPIILYRWQRVKNSNKQNAHCSGNTKKCFKIKWQLRVASTSIIAILVDLAFEFWYIFVDISVPTSAVFPPLWFLQSLRLFPPLPSPSSQARQLQMTVYREWYQQYISVKISLS